MTKDEHDAIRGLWQIRGAHASALMRNSLAEFYESGSEAAREDAIQYQLESAELYATARGER